MIAPVRLGLIVATAAVAGFGAVALRAERLVEEAERPPATRPAAAAALTIRPVAAGLREVEAWFVAAGNGELAGTGVDAQPDLWLGPDGREHHDVYLMAQDRAALEPVVARLTAQRPLPAGVSVAYELVTPTRDDGAAGAADAVDAPFYRTYVVHDEVIIGNADVARAVVTYDPDTLRPEVSLELTLDGGRRFGDATSARIGERLAILVDDRVMSAPVVHGAIVRGRLTITMGGASPTAAEAEAKALARALDPDGQPADDGAGVGGPPPGATTLAWAMGALVAVLGGALAWGGAALADRRRWFTVAPAVHPAATPPRWGAALGPAALTLGLPLALWFAARALLLPGLNRTEVEQLFARSGSVDPATLGIFALGVMPAASAFIFVELAALILEQLMPTRRGRRLGAPAERRGLDRAGWLVTLALAAVQAYLMAQYLASLDGHGVALLTLPYARMLIMVSLIAGVMVHVVAAELITRHGLCNGYLALLGAAAVAVAVRLATADAPRSGIITAPPALLGLGLIAAAALTAIAATRLRTVTADGAGPRLPYTGAVPASLVRGSLGLLGLLGLWSSWMAEQLVRLVEWAPLIELGACVPLTALILWSTRQAWTTAGVVATAGFLAALTLPPFLVAAPYRAMLPLADGVLLGLVLAELAVGLRARARLPAAVTVLVVHDGFAADAAADRLAAAGIPHAVLGGRARAALRLLGPLVPIELRVPRAHAEAAQAELARLRDRAAFCVSVPG